ncbi:MAG: aldose 1-epimerase [Blastocatellia bacterium]|nr:aldose 1-epimerase [Blastocatellia bacterium]
MTEHYSIESEIRGGAEIFTLRQSEDTYAEVAPAWGNNCFAMRAGEPVLETVAFEEFSKRPGSYGIPILFPFPNRVKDGEFTFRGTRYKVDPPRHGFVRDKAWTIEGAGASPDEGSWIKSSIDAARYPEEILAQFPFPFRLEVTYRLKNSSLEMDTRVINTGDRDLPFGFGIHPYFRHPETGTICVPARKRWELADFLPTGKLLDVEGSYDLREASDLSGLVLDDIYTDVITDSDGRVRCTLDDRRNDLQTVVEFDPKEFPHVVAYTAPAPRRAVCIEPYTCPTDAFNLDSRGVESNLIALAPGETMAFKVAISARGISGA